MFLGKVKKNFHQLDFQGSWENYYYYFLFSQRRKKLEKLKWPHWWGLGFVCNFGLWTWLLPSFNFWGYTSYWLLILTYHTQLKTKVLMTYFWVLLPCYWKMVWITFVHCSSHYSMMGIRWRNVTLFPPFYYFCVWERGDVCYFTMG